ncbi:glycosyltransferase involved in cell wall biosynthesis [Orbus hercynius]|uniref:Glycosyltransferase involved in cell wall biosynthesis n=1 Tax=Orbus hercynius TaxID=593135 RepID=A0A495REP4_9GAMM|nr:glycosyltransferase family 2 protein [Orbus hercynius]RKS85952.1 glycosyltransferase involved in cell wall biosynthesis [Orbus hercynius]
MLEISVLIVAKNEQHNIGDCIKSCQFAKEVIVIDDYSSDDTAKIATSLGAKVIQRALAGDWGGQQTFAIEQASYDWIFLIDADERVSDELAQQISEAVNRNDKTAYWIQRQNKFRFNKATHGILRPDFVCRLMPKQGTYVEGYVHQQIVTPYPSQKLSGYLYHYTYDNWEQYFNKFNKYTTLSAEKYKKNHKKCYFFKDIMLRPLWAFMKVYFIQGGCLDGKMGWILSVNHYFYTMNKYVKLYYLYKSNGKL